MSKCNAQQLLQDGSCFLCLEAGIRQVLELQLLCEILNNGIGGGGSGVTGDGTLFPATSQTTLSLNTQSANLFFAGPSSGAAAAPTFRAMVNADLGTGLTPQFLRLGIGSAAHATTKLLVTGISAGAGVNVIVAQFECPTSNPFFILGTAGANTGAFWGYDRATNTMQFGIFGGNGLKIDTTGNANIFANCDAATYSCGGSAGFNGTFDGTNTVTVTHGIVTSIA